VTLHLYDSKAQALREFTPLQPGVVGIYLCGPTVQSEPHVGHLRSALAYDQLRRWLTAKGLQVTLVRNVTDIDDKVLANAVVRNKPWWALAYEMELVFNAAYRSLGIAAPTYEPRATASIPEMLALIERLVANGYAYQSTDGSADVYFAASKWPQYGELTRQRIEDMADAADADPRGKLDPHDFALWKAAKADEPETAAWDSRFGRGRPGWHIECSAMSTKYLGSAFDIHGGGLDLRFPRQRCRSEDEQVARQQHLRRRSPGSGQPASGSFLARLGKLSLHPRLQRCFAHRGSGQYRPHRWFPKARCPDHWRQERSKPGVVGRLWPAAKGVCFCHG
jgi:cysteinyl-tRNA synthetase